MPPTIRYVEADGVTATDSVEDLGHIIAGATDTPRKFGGQNIAGRVFGGSPFSGCELRRVLAGGTDLGYEQLRIALDDSGTLPPPFGVTATPGAAGAGGVWAGTGTVFYKVTAQDGSGETDGSIEVSATLTATTQQITLAWTPPAGATGLRLWRSTTTETYTPTALRATLSGSATGYVDSGAATSSGSIPTANTTGSGSAPATFSEGPLVVSPLADGDIQFFWVRRVILSSAPGEDELTFVELAELP